LLPASLIVTVRPIVENADPRKSSVVCTHGDLMRNPLVPGTGMRTELAA
jgi:hypothetical protein